MSEINVFTEQRNKCRY